MLAGRMAGQATPAVLTVLLTLALTACSGGVPSPTPRHSIAPGPASRHGTATSQAPQRGSGQGVPMTPTPGDLLAFCRTSPLLRPICPRQIPMVPGSSGPRIGYGCFNTPNGVPRSVAAGNALFTSRRCTDAGWSYEQFNLPVPAEGIPVSAWDGTEWFAVSFAPLYPPPYQVHVDIEASAGSPPIAVSATGRLQRAKHITDALLNPKRPHAVSFGWVRWYGKRGQLLLMPANAGGGEVAGHLIFYFASGGVNYEISLHAWASKVRINDGGVNQVIRAPQAGPALPHVITTLKGIVGSALAG